MQLDAFVVEAEGVSKHFGDRVAVDSVDLRIPGGVAFGYLGPNGAGKTTLIRVLQVGQSVARLPVSDAAVGVEDPLG